MKSYDKKKDGPPSRLSVESSESESEFSHSDSSFSDDDSVLNKEGQIHLIVLSPSTMRTNWKQML